MKVDLTAAGLTEESRHILSVAANLLGAYRMAARLREWDGTRCDALFVDALDGFGRSAAASAQRRGIRVIHFSDRPLADDDSVLHIPPTGPIATIARQLQHLFALPVAAPTGEAQPSNIVRVATAPALAGHDLAFRNQGREVLLLRSASRVLAASLSDILYCRDHIDDPAWRIDVLEAAAARPRTHDVAVSLDSFLCQAVDAAVGAFPPHIAGRWALQDWPDLGAATQQVDALRLAQALQRKPASMADLVVASGLGLDAVTRYLWAFRAANLVHLADAKRDDSARANAAAVATTAAPAGGVLARLARRFGLTRN